MSNNQLQRMSKFANEITASSLDSGDLTIDREFMEAMRVAEIKAPLVEEGIVWVKSVAPGKDKVVFTVLLPQSFTFTEVDAKGSESVGGGLTTTFETYGAPRIVEVTPTTKSTTVFLADNMDLVDPVTRADLAVQFAEEMEKALEIAALTTLVTEGNYVVATSVRNANGFTTAGVVAVDDILIPADLIDAKDDVKTNQRLMVNKAVMHTTQLSQLETNADFSPGQSANANFKKAMFDETGRLVNFAEMKIIESINIPLQTSGDFSTNNGRHVIVGRERLLCGRGNHPQRDLVSDFRIPEEHGTRRTLDINYDHAVIHPDGIRLIRAVEA